MSDEYRPRMTVELREDQYFKLNQILPHGMKKHLFQALVDGVIEAYNKGGTEALSAIVGRHIDSQQLAALGNKSNG